MSLYATKSACVVDHGLFMELAITLSAAFGKVWLYSPWESAFPRSNDMLVGRGVSGIERTDDLWGIVDDVDLFVFPDIYLGSLQLHLEGLGKRVWGSRMGEELEIWRRQSKTYLSSLGIPIGPFEVVTGMGALRAYLREHPDQYVKISRTRGDMETFYAKNYPLIEPRLDELEHMLGAKERVTEFIVEQPIHDAVESGYDGYSVDGQFPSLSMMGIEVKDKAYVGRVVSEETMVPQILEQNRLLSETLRRYRYRNFLSTETRITEDGTAWLIDPCMRMGSPPGALMLEMIGNIPDIIWHGAEGDLVEPVYTGRYGADVLIRSEWADSHWQAIQFPADLRASIKFRNLAVIGGYHYVVPQSVGIPEIGEIVAVGDTMEEAVARVREVAERVEGYYLEMYDESLDEAVEALQSLDGMCGTP